ncbi:hypothetical protein [Clostridium perfringens]|uniref:hypothetical protein n=1 Tax=Clostridium perfringens TaxID=1502 RepID=UPI001E2F3180|nr:hypothetical protein [Clostridium perfringens]MCC5421371.1 hypothetical protein [Clostridium perfringens]MCC5430823.1 hypothetical protein [Clostridium perfringens]MCC5445301.1 hypothetical protein [Clostridium perfringens]MCC5448270.1 hypothetical protein [Clostridium perfringens]WVL77745.1 hypothetical protein LMS42_004905 [Clostridium perfringens]
MNKEQLVKGFKILQLEGKDILTKEIQTHNDIKSKNKTYGLKTQLFKANLDYSLDVIKLNEVVRKSSIIEQDEKLYTTAIISVTFNYSINEKGKKLTTRDIRELLYKDGFDITIKGEKKHFVRYKRSSGSARVGKCLFIRKDYYNDMMKWSLMGIDPVKHGHQLPSLEAYISLTTSSIVDTLKIEPKNILLIEDGESTFKDTVMATELVDGKLKTSEKTINVTNKIWDGQSLIDISLLGDYKKKGAIQVRNRFFKGMCFNANIQKFFEDNNITDISQLNGQTIATDIKDIKLITTPSSVKYLKFGTFEEWINLIDDEWGICKYEKKTKFFGGKLVQTHYQLLNTVNLDKEGVKELLQPTVEYIDLLKNDITVFKKHIKCNYNILEDEENKDTIDLKITNDFMYNLLTLNDKFSQTRIFKNFKYKVLESAKKNLQKGHMLIQGNYSVVCSNAIEMLNASIGKWSGTSVLNKGNIYCNRWGNGVELLGCRSPHVTMGNLLIAKNEKIKVIDTYMNSTKEIVHITSIKSNVLERMSGMDFDGDQFILTDNKILINAVNKHYDDFLVPTNTVANLNKTEYRWDSLSKANLDFDTSVNKIGEIINLSAYLNAEYWNRYNNGESKESLKDLYALICQLDVLSCIEIDKAKKPSPVNVIKELNNARDSKYLQGNRPQFFSKIDEFKGNKTKLNKYYTGRIELLKETKSYKKKKLTEEELEKQIGIINEKIENIEGRYNDYDITIDYYIDLVNNIKESKHTNSGESFMAVLFDNKEVKKLKTGKENQRQINKFIDIISIHKKEQAKIWADTNSESSDKYKRSEEVKSDLIKELSKINMKKETIITILKRLDKDLRESKTKTDYTRNSRTILTALYNVYKLEFLSMINITSNVQTKLVKSDKGEYELFGIRFTKKDIKETKGE